MRIWIVENEEAVKWERLGECNGCGECCTGHTISFEWETVSCNGSQEDDDARDYSKKEGWSSFKHHGVWWWYRITSTEDKDENVGCGSLVDGRCEVWKDEVEFPPLCRYFPVHPTDLEHFPKCGFSFRRA